MGIKVKFDGVDDNSVYEFSHFTLTDLIVHLYSAVKTKSRTPQISPKCVNDVIDEMGQNSFFLNEIANEVGRKRHLGLTVVNAKTDEPEVIVDFNVFKKGQKKKRAVRSKNRHDTLKFDSLLKYLNDSHDALIHESSELNNSVSSNQAAAAGIGMSEDSSSDLSIEVDSSQSGADSSSPSIFEMEESEPLAASSSSSSCGCSSEHCHSGDKSDTTQASILASKSDIIGKAQPASKKEKRVTFDLPSYSSEEEENSSSSHPSKQAHPIAKSSPSKVDLKPSMITSVVTFSFMWFVRAAAMSVSLLFGAAAFLLSLAAQKRRAGLKSNYYDEFCNHTKKNAEQLTIDIYLESMPKPEWQALKSGVEVQRGGYFNQFKSCLTGSWKHRDLYLAGMKLAEENPELGLESVEQAREKKAKFQ